jgi:large subunit ribosomal protein L31
LPNRGIGAIVLAISPERAFKVKYMKKDTHPEYHPEAKVECQCGNSFTVGSTAKKVQVELCSECHPFYTGKQKLVDTARRVEKFQERAAKKVAGAAKAKKEKAVKRHEAKVAKAAKASDK